MPVVFGAKKNVVLGTKNSQLGVLVRQQQLVNSCSEISFPKTVFHFNQIQLNNSNISNGGRVTQRGEGGVTQISLQKEKQENDIPSLLPQFSRRVPLTFAI